nr:MAG TPA: hypothetical protein [Caudoviricetes sp.]
MRVRNGPHFFQKLLRIFCGQQESICGRSADTKH